MVERWDRTFVNTLDDVDRLLRDGYVFDPWLCAKGYPVMMGENACYWVLIRPEVLDDPESIAKICPFKALPVEPVIDKPAGYGTRFIPHGDQIAMDKAMSDGYVLLHKDHADVVGPDKVKGTIMTLIEKPEPEEDIEE